VDPDDRQTADGNGEDVLNDNVVRLPRDWLGPRDELIPIGPSANGQTGGSDDRFGLPATASDFWGEDSSSLQSVLAGSTSRPPLPRVRVPTAFSLQSRSIAVVVAAAAVVAAFALLAPQGHKTAIRATNVERQSSTPSAASYLAMTARMLRALESSAAKSTNAVVGRGQHTPRHAGVTASHRSAHHTRQSERSTVVVGQVRYVTAATSTSGNTAAAPLPPPQPATNPSTESSSPATGSGNQPAVGANGALGPGTSPDG
jgi:hypothetical protein